MIGEEEVGKIIRESRIARRAQDARENLYMATIGYLVARTYHDDSIVKASLIMVVLVCCIYFLAGFWARLRS